MRPARQIEFALQGIFFWRQGKKMENKTKEKILHKVVTFLNREELDFVDAITKDIYFAKGKNISRSGVIKSIIELMLLAKEGEEEIYEELITLITKYSEQSLKKGGGK